MTISADHLASIRAAVRQHAGDAALPAKARTYKTNAKNAQEAHEAIVATQPELGPGIAGRLGTEARKLYGLIWRRSLACQMVNAEFDVVSIELLRFVSHQSAYPFSWRRQCIWDPSYYLGGLTCMSSHGGLPDG
jgi:DNA topoisomerase I